MPTKKTAKQSARESAIREMSKKQTSKKQKQLTLQELKRFLKTVSSDQTKAIHDEIASKRTEANDREVGRAKISLEFYYKLKGELEDACIEKLREKLGGPGHGLCSQYKKPGGTAGKWSKSKILKIIANLPAKKPNTDLGLVKAVRTIEFGKQRKWSKAVKEKRKLAAETKKKKDTQTIARGAMFKQKESDRKKTATTKKATTASFTPKPKSAGAMAVGDGLTKHQRYEANSRVITPEKQEQRNEQRRQRRAAGKAN